ncbi:MAG: GGDEF domain-containing protein [Lachnospiraceae bacterium]|nr:GGDEF domain-containing protein [Lachnospiraceae bacterium]
MRNKRLADSKWIMLGILLLSFLIAFVLNALISTVSYGKDALDSHIQVDVLRADGSLEQYDSNIFDTVNKGDTILAKIYLPEEFRMSYPALCFHCYHCVLTLKYKDQVLYTYGEDLYEKNKAIGAVHARVEFPEEAFGSYLTLEAFATEDNAENRLVNFTLVNAADSLQYYISGNEVNFVVFLSCMVMGVATACGVFFYYLFTRKGRDLMIVMSFIGLISTYVLCYYGMLNYIIFNPKINADLEYMSLFLLPVPACAFFNGVFEKSRLGKPFHVGTLVSLVVFLFCTAMHFSPFWWIHYTTLLPIAHLEVVIVALMVIIGSIYYKSENEWTRIIQFGTIIYALIILAELLRFSVSRFLPMPQLIYKVSLLPFSFLELILTLIVSTIVHQMGILRQQQEQIQLKRLAYQDVLTGVMSRTRCEEYCKLLTDEGIKDYTVFYLDLNHLKLANDRFGHEYGDHYLQKTAEVLQDVFESADIISRMGGDEFVVIFGKDVRWRITNMCHRLDDAFAAINEAHIFPFTVSVARGYASSTQNEPLEIEAALNLADTRMYENKKKMKADMENR